MSRRISENAATGKLMPSLPKAKKEIIIDGTMRRRKTETSKRSEVCHNLLKTQQEVSHDEQPEQIRQQRFREDHICRWKSLCPF